MTIMTSVMIKEGWEWDEQFDRLLLQRQHLFVLPPETASEEQRKARDHDN